MAKIDINFKENNRGTYDFTVVQNGKMFFKKEYTVSEDNEGVVTQAQVFFWVYSLPTRLSKRKIV